MKSSRSWRFAAVALALLIPAAGVAQGMMSGVDLTTRSFTQAELSRA